MGIGAAMLITMFIIPIVVLVIGIVTKKKMPQNRNGNVGYRTKLSRSSQEAWEYANKRMSSIMVNVGAILLVVSVVICLIFIKSSVETTSIVSTIVMVMQCVAICTPFVIIEKELRDKFGDGSNK